MKRFFCAVLLLILTVTSAAVLHCKTIRLTNTLIGLLAADAPAGELAQWWDENGSFFLVVLPHRDAEEIKTAVFVLTDEQNISAAAYRVKKIELRQTVICMRDSMRFNVQNIL